MPSPLPSSATPIDKQTTPLARRVIVIGAGLAGLTAARALLERDIEVVVLEARNRIGGRCHTRDGIDLGAHWIHGTEGNPLTNLARQLGVETLFVGGDSTYTGGWEDLALTDAAGRMLDGTAKLRSILQADEIHDALADLRRRRLADALPDLSLSEAVAQAIAHCRVPDEQRTLVDWHIALAARDDCAADADKLSLFWYDDGYEVYGYGDSVLLRGYGEIVERLAEGLDIRLGCVVQRVESDGPPHAPVRVLAADDAGVQVFEADCALVTLPLGVLKSGAVLFDPPLPAARRAAIDRLAMGNLTKITVCFAAPFWPRDQYVFGMARPPVDRHPTVIVNLWKTHRIPALQMLVGGDAGRAVERQTPDEIREWAVCMLRHVFGDLMHEPQSVECTAWDSDPYAHGAYSYIPVGATPDDLDLLAEPVGQRLFFAGEATYRHHWGCAHGAYASGLREAARIAGDPSILPPRQFAENRRWRAMMMRAARFFNARSQSVSGRQVRECMAVLDTSDIFAVVPATERQVLAMMFEQVSFEEGAIICSAGDQASEVYVVDVGEVEVIMPDGTRALVVSRGGIVGEYGMFRGPSGPGGRPGTRTATLVAVGRCRLLVLDYQRFRRFLLAFPEAALALMELTIDRLLIQSAANPSA